MKIVIGVIIACVIAVCAYLLLSYTPQAPVNPSAQTPSITLTPTSLPATNSALLSFVSPSLPISWESEKTATVSYQGKSVSGKELTGTVNYRSGYLKTLANTDDLRQNGWVEDINLAADGPNGSQWGYTKTQHAAKQLLIFSYTNLSFTPPPKQTSCPCAFSVRIFLGNI